MKNFKEALKIAEDSKIKPTMVVPCPYDKNILEALTMVQKSNIANIITIGDKAKIDAIIKDYDLEFNNESLIERIGDLSAIEKAYSLLADDKADIIMKGIVQTKDFMKIILSDKDFIKRKLLTHVAIYDVTSLDRLLFVSDPSIMIEPSVGQKIVIIDNALELLLDLDIKNPKIAIISSTEIPNEKIISSLDALEIMEFYENKDFKASIYGPLAIDNAISIEASKLKNIDSDVAGNADLLIMPNLDAGNIFCKGLSYIANIESAGIVMGANKPIVLTSRSASPKEKFNSIVISCLLAHKNII